MTVMTQKEKILDLFQRRGKVTNIELSHICLRYGARLEELRRDGFVINTERLKGAVYSYTYVGGPSSEGGAVEPLNGVQLGLIDNRPFDD